MAGKSSHAACGRRQRRSSGFGLISKQNVPPKAMPNAKPRMRGVVNRSNPNTSKNSPGRSWPSWLSIPITPNWPPRLARAVTEQARPVGSGTVARTKQIPIEKRAEAAVIAWMRHQTTAYDSMVIPRGKGKRREVRRMLAQWSQPLLVRYRRGEAVGDECLLQQALSGSGRIG